MRVEAIDFSITPVNHPPKLFIGVALGRTVVQLLLVAAFPLKHSVGEETVTEANYVHPILSKLLAFFESGAASHKPFRILNLMASNDRLRFGG
ncbi:MAG: hypothetical protein BGO16_11050 [Nitrobacter sp. 62-23]|nr:MAG: hypothetical protein BGO16_11050 [Nitrobacter sp. 62-23]